MVADQPARVSVALDGLRRLMASRLGLVPSWDGRFDPAYWAFQWVTEPPLFDWSEDEGKWVSAHHPFTSPVSEDLDPRTARARAYDIVLNGFELASGSIRIHRPEIQQRIFEILGLTEDESREKFGFLLEAFRYGVPPHGGIAPGLDRIVMLLAGRDNVRDVIAFPKTASGAELLTGAPTEPSKEQLDLLGLRFVAEPKRPTGLETGP
jgi:aspartyl-tRNA synthetase